MFEGPGNPKLATAGVSQAATASNIGGNLEGKETRFGVSASAIEGNSITATSAGSPNSAHESYTPLGGSVPLTNILLGEVSPGGAGRGLYGKLILVMLSVFIAGLMVGRTPEYLGKKIQAREMKLAVIYILAVPATVLGFGGWAIVNPTALAGLSASGRPRARPRWPTRSPRPPTTTARPSPASPPAPLVRAGARAWAC